MKSLNQKLIVSGFALLLFGILLALASEATYHYFSGGLGLFFVLVGCFTKGNNNDEHEK